MHGHIHVPHPDRLPPRHHGLPGHPRCHHRRLALPAHRALSAPADRR
ncbi:hypothetical protein [Ornithinimicrobium kibberense]